MAARKRFRCVGCNTGTGGRFDECPKCHGWGTCVPIKEGDGKDREQVDGRFSSLADAQAFDPPRIAIAPEWDQALGGGLALGSMVCLWGKPGANKTTELLRILSMQGGLFVDTEYLDDGGMLKRTADNARINCARISFTSAEKPREAIQAIRARSWGVVGLDSLSAFDHDGSMSSRELKKTATEAIDAARRSGATLICVLHSRRDGDMSGPQWLQHKFDTVVCLTQSTIRVIKNRFGPMPLRVKRKPSKPLSLVG